MSVVYNHRQGKLLNRLNYIPDLNIIAVDAGGELSTVEYNRNLNFPPELLKEYDKLYDDILVAFSNKDDIAIALCARQSTQLHINWTGN